MTDRDNEELYTDALSDCPCDFEIYRSNVKIDSLSEESDIRSKYLLNQLCTIACM